MFIIELLHKGVLKERPFLCTFLSITKRVSACYGPLPLKSVLEILMTTLQIAQSCRPTGLACDGTMQLGRDGLTLV